VFVERGFAGARLEEICARAGLTRGAFYSSFESKDELLLALFDRIGAQTAEELRLGLAALEGQPPGDFSQALMRFTQKGQFSRESHLLFQEFELYALRNPEVAVKLGERRQTLRDAMAAQLQAYADRSNLELTVDPGQLMRAINALHSSGFAQHLIQPDKIGPSEVFEIFAPILISYALRPRTTA
jgi:AcrR family transcriptional regulator